MCNDGRNRRGKMMIQYQGGFKRAGSEYNITFDNFYVNDVLIMGSSMIKHMGDNVDGKPYFNATIKAKALQPGAVDTIYWNAKHQYTCIKGSETIQWEDDIYEILGIANGFNQNKNYFASNITKPLIREVLCRYFKSGTIDMQPKGLALRIIDLGPDGCDKDASVEINGKRWLVSLN
jgi:hypothetical protein